MSKIDSTQKIMTLHPQGKQGVNIAKDKYQVMREAVLEVLKGKDLTHTELFEALHNKLEGKFEGSIAWYGETLKLDLEARKIIERTDDRPQKYRIIE